MKGYLFFIVVLTMFAVSCQQSELIEETILDEQLTESNEQLEDRRYEETWEQYARLTRRRFQIQNNIWNMNAPGGSSQKVWATDRDNWGVVAYHTVGDGQVKSFPGILTGKHYGGAAPNTRGLPARVKNLGNLWCKWHQTNTMTQGNAAMEFWFHGAPEHGYEEAAESMMIWTERKNLNPIAWQYNGHGAIPVDTQWFNGYEYKVYRGRNANGTHVQTFVKVNNDGKFEGNVKTFIDYCKSKGWLNDYHYLLNAQAGWEFVSGGEATTTAYELWSITK